MVLNPPLFLYKTVINHRKYNPLVKIISKYIFYALLLVSFLLVQADLKETPQYIALVIFFITFSLKLLNQKTFFKIAYFIFMLVLFHAFAFHIVRIIYPSKSLTESHVGMDISGVYVAILSSIIAVILTVINFNNNKNSSLRIEKHLVIATSLSSSVIFIYFELL